MYTADCDSGEFRWLNICSTWLSSQVVCAPQFEKHCPKARWDDLVGLPHSPVQHKKDYSESVNHAKLLSKVQELEVWSCIIGPLERKETTLKFYVCICYSHRHGSGILWSDHEESQCLTQLCPVKHAEIGPLPESLLCNSTLIPTGNKRMT